MEHTTRHPYSIVGHYPIEREGRELDVITIVMDFLCPSDAVDYCENISWGLPLDVNDGTLVWNLILTSATLVDTEVTLVGIGSRLTELTILPAPTGLPLKANLVFGTEINSETNTLESRVVVEVVDRRPSSESGQRWSRNTIIPAQQVAIGKLCTPSRKSLDIRNLRQSGQLGS